MVSACALVAALPGPAGAVVWVDPAVGDVFTTQYTGWYSPAGTDPAGHAVGPYHLSLSQGVFGKNGPIDGVCFRADINVGSAPWQAQVYADTALTDGSAGLWALTSGTIVNPTGDPATYSQNWNATERLRGIEWLADQFGDYTFAISGDVTFAAQDWNGAASGLGWGGIHDALWVLGDNLSTAKYNAIWNTSTRDWLDAAWTATHQPTVTLSNYLVLLPTVYEASQPFALVRPGTHTTPTPEPATLALVACGALAGLIGKRRRSA